MTSRALGILGLVLSLVAGCRGASDDPTKDTSSPRIAQQAFAIQSISGGHGDAGDGGPVCVGDSTVPIGGSQVCTGALAAATFTQAICSCGALTASATVTTDGFNSTQGPPTGGLGGNVVSSNATWSHTVNIGGDFVTPGKLSVSATSTVRGNLYLGGTGSASAPVTIDENAYLVGSLPKNFTVDGTVSHVASVASPCNCSNPIPVVSIVAARRSPSNDNATIGLSASAAVGSTTRRSTFRAEATTSARST